MSASSAPTSLRSKNEAVAKHEYGRDQADGDDDADSRQGTALKLALSQPFYYLGDLALTCPQLDHYVVAVSLHDLSLWLIYNAWSGSSSVADDDLEDATALDDDSYFDDSAATEMELKRWYLPDSDPSWAHFPGLARRTLMGKLADNVQTWHFDHSAEVRMQPVWTDEDVVPAFVSACLTSDGYAIRPQISWGYSCRS